MNYQCKVSQYLSYGKLNIPQWRNGRDSQCRGQPLGACLICATVWKEEQVREYASLVAAVLAICFLKDSGRPLFRNSLRARNCSSSCEFSEASRLLSSKMEMTADALRAFFSGPPEEPLEPATETVCGQREALELRVR